MNIGESQRFSSVQFTVKLLPTPHTESRERRLTEGDATTGCVDLMETLFENYKDEGVGWGTNGFGYKNFQTIRGGAKTSLPMRLSGFA